MAKNNIDSFTLEIIKEGLLAVGDEMFVTMQRTSMSTITRPASLTQRAGSSHRETA